MNVTTLQAGQVITLDHRHIEGLLFVDNPRAESSVELRVALRDGRNFGFTVYTPAALTHIMAQTRNNSVVDPDMLIVNEVTLEAVIGALEKMLAAGIERFGLAL